MVSGLFRNIVSFFTSPKRLEELQSKYAFLKEKNNSLLGIFTYLILINEKLQRDHHLLKKMVEEEGIYPDRIFKNSSSNDSLPVVPARFLCSDSKREELKELFNHEKNEINRREDSKPEDVKKNKIYLSGHQEKMVFQNNPSVRVLAGAGSGKSTSLVLRVIFLAKYLNIPWSEISVCTFTNESRNDFVEKLLIRCEQFGIPMDEKRARKVVWSFHSLALNINKIAYSGEVSVVIGHGVAKESEDGRNISNQTALDKQRTTGVVQKVLDDYGKETTLQELQWELYEKLYKNSEFFRKNTLSLYFYSINRIESKYSGIYTGEFEDHLYRYCFEEWAEDLGRYRDRVKGYLRKSSIRVGSLELYSHMYIPGLKLHIFLGVDPFHASRNPIVKGSNVKIRTKLYERFSYVYKNVNFSSQRYCTVLNVSELMDLIDVCESYLSVKGEDSDLLTPPRFECVCRGERRNKEVSKRLIHNGFLSLIDYSYSIGVPLYKCNLQKLMKIADNKFSSDYEIVFLRLAITYHVKWLEFLKERKWTTFDQIFYELSKADHPAYGLEVNHVFGKLKHLLVDEFQDISPNVLGFLKQIKTRITQNSPRSIGSLTCVGDDYQAIYGFRGSDSSYIIDYESHFPSVCAPSPVELIENYRSHESILKSGGLVIERVKVKSNKTYECKSKYGDKDTGCTFHHGVGLGRSPNYEKALEDIKKEITKSSDGENKKILLLGRNRYHFEPKDNSDFSNFVKRNEAVNEMTIHGSKGLEADCVFVFGDITEPDYNPLKETLYGYAGLRGTYHSSQVDEGYRLAYVAITRAKRKLVWYFSSPEDKPDDNLISYMALRSDLTGSNTAS